MSQTIGFRPTEEDARIIAEQQHPGESISEVLRRGLAALEEKQWLRQARKAAKQLKDEDLNSEPEAW